MYVKLHLRAWMGRWGLDSYFKAQQHLMLSRREDEEGMARGREGNESEVSPKLRKESISREQE